MAANSDNTKRFFGLVLIVGGAIWLVCTGLCTLVFVTFVMRAYGPESSDMPVILSVAGPSALFGWGLYVLGRRLRPKAQ